MWPRAAIGVTNLLIVPVVSVAAPPLKMTAPVSPSNPRSRPPPRLHTTASLLPSVVVTIGEPCPPWFAHQATVARGGAPGLVLTERESPCCPIGQAAPFALKAPS